MAPKSDRYRAFSFIPVVAFIVLALSLSAIFEATGLALILIYAALSLYALLGVRQSIESLSLSVLMSFLNPYYNGGLETATILRYLPIIAAICRSSWHLLSSRRRCSIYTFIIILFSVYALLISLFESTIPDVSIFKIILFAVVSTVILFLFRQDTSTREYWTSWFYTIHSSIALISVPFAFLSAGWLKNGHGLQGITNHPQVFGVFLAPMTACLIAHGLRERSILAFQAFILILSLCLLMLSECRTAMFAVFVSLIPSVSERLLSYIQSPRPLRIRFAHLAILVSIALVMFTFWDTISSYAVSHFLKTSNVGSSGEFLYSRSEQISDQLRTIEEKPITGIGFGMQRGGVSYTTTKREPIFDFPTSSPTESGFLPIAVQAQLGIGGTIIVIFLLWALIYPPLLAKDFTMLTLSLAIIATNFGEMTFFAIGGQGTLVWLYLACSAHKCSRVPSRKKVRVGIHYPEVTPE